ncbi:MAG: cellulase [Bacteroidales bacterium]|nr:cellulase [Bacteroidales bacterium]
MATYKRSSFIIYAAALLLSFVINAPDLTAQNKKINPFKDKEVKQYVKDSLQTLIARCEVVLKAAYMKGEYVTTHYDVPGWEGYPVEEYTYYTGKDIKTGRPKKGRVYLLMPTAEQLAYWTISACWKTVHSLDYQYTNTLLRFIRWQSGAQFAVRGVVYEDMYTAGYYEPYVFKDGITVYVADPKMKAGDDQLAECTEEQLQFYLDLSDKDLKPYTGSFARICSTTREMYYSWGGTTDVGVSSFREGRSLNFLPVIRDLYKKALKSKDNELIDAWCNVNLKDYPYKGRD